MRALAILFCLTALIMAVPAAAQDAPPAQAGAAAGAQPGNGRVIGGEPVLKGKAPWMVELFFKDNFTATDLKDDARKEAAHDPNSQLLADRPVYDQNHHCGGVLIARNWVLTAGHCIEDVSTTGTPTTFVPLFKKYIRLRLGSVSIVPGSGSVCKAIDVVPAGPDDGDLALVRINQAACTPRPEPGSVAPIRIAGLSPQDVLLSDFREGAPLFSVFGWGLTKPREGGALSVVTSADRHDVDAAHLDPASPALLKAGPLDFVGRDTCLKASPFYPREVKPSMICAGVTTGAKDQCNGDSGGPLVLDNKVAADQPPVTLLIGLVHGGHGCGLTATPGIYEYVPGHLQWIARTIGNGDARKGQRMLVQPQAGT